MQKYSFIDVHRDFIEPWKSVAGYKLCAIANRDCSIPGRSPYPHNHHHRHHHSSGCYMYFVERGLHDGSTSHVLRIGWLELMGYREELILISRT